MKKCTLLIGKAKFFVQACLCSVIVLLPCTFGQDVCVNQVGDGLLQCIQKQIVHQQQETANLAQELRAAHQRIVELEAGMQFYPHPCENAVCVNGAYEWIPQPISFANPTYSGLFFLSESVKLENTNAKYALANIFVSFTRDPERKDVDHVVHIFGRNLSKNTFYWEDPTIERERAPDRFFSSAKGDYAAFVLNGENGQGDSYGMHGFLMIPLDEHQQMEVILANAYGFGKHHVYLRVFGYLE